MTSWLPPETSPSKYVANPTPVPAGRNGSFVRLSENEKFPDGLRRFAKLRRIQRWSVPSFTMCLPRRNVRLSAT